MLKRLAGCSQHKPQVYIPNQSVLCKLSGKLHNLFIKHCLSTWRSGQALIEQTHYCWLISLAHQFLCWSLRCEMPTGTSWGSWILPLLPWSQGRKDRCLGHRALALYVCVCLCLTCAWETRTMLWFVLHCCTTYSDITLFQAGRILQKSIIMVINNG